MQKIWFVIIKDIKKGPFDILGLRSLSYFTPDTLVWCEGMPKPLPARWIPELKDAFKDSNTHLPVPGEGEDSPQIPKQLPATDELAIDMGGVKPPVLYWLLAIAILLLILLLQRFSG